MYKGYIDFTQSVRPACCIHSVTATVLDGFFPYKAQMITSVRGCVAHNDLWSWPISLRSFSRDFGLKLLKYDISCCVCCTQLVQFLVDSYRNWPQYGLRWSGLCCHSRHSTPSGAGRRAAACGSGSTNHDSADRMSGQFLFYHENEAIHNDKSRDDHDDEPPCWNALAGNAIVMMKASIDTVSGQ